MNFIKIYFYDFTIKIWMASLGLVANPRHSSHIRWHEHICMSRKLYYVVLVYHLYSIAAMCIDSEAILSRFLFPKHVLFVIFFCLIAPKFSQLWKEN